MNNLTCFKAYDIRGRLGEELNEDIAWRIGRAYGEYLKPKTIVLGGDVRLTSEALKLALAKGLQDAGVDVLDIGMSGTEEIYFATFHLGVDGGIEVTASHNPMDYNGMKLVYKYYDNIKKRCLNGEKVPYSDLDVLNLRQCFREFSLEAYPAL
ncbi:hypothetical protein MJM30_24330, partial [Salmonella enterica subsp. enterica serovar Lubbock]|nr:hypothetical protein [Salmonella enterica subsp. enterica serovar Lubbock]